MCEILSVETVPCVICRLWEVPLCELLPVRRSPFARCFLWGMSHVRDAACWECCLCEILPVLRLRVTGCGGGFLDRNFACEKCSVFGILHVGREGPVCLMMSVESARCAKCCLCRVVLVPDAVCEESPLCVILWNQHLVV